jgi:Na+/H+ antiporter NhaD/arsenite permease-like protein
MSQETLALVIFAVTYLLIVAERPHPTLAALLGAGAMILTGLLDQRQAQAAVDWNVIALLVGMMILVNGLEQTGAFERVAVLLAKRTRGRPIVLMIVFFALTAVGSALLDNVTTVLLMCPITFILADALGIDPMPWVLGEVIASNIGGTATLIGDPPNIMIGSAAGLDFDAFLEHMAPAAIIIGIVIAGGMALFYRRALRPSADAARAATGLALPPLKTDRRTLVICLAVLALVMAGFLVHGALGLQAGTIAMGGAVVFMVVAKADLRKTLAAIQWPTLFFFVGLFIVVAGVQETGWLDKFGRWLVILSRGNMLGATIMLLWGAAATSAVVDNIPATAALIPAVKAMAQALYPDAAAPWALPEAMPLWWALALGACLGGNATSVAASANVVVLGIAERAGHPISFSRFLRIGVPVSVISLLLSSAYLLLRYLR